MSVAAERDYTLRLAGDDKTVLHFKAFDIIITDGCARVIGHDGGTTAALERGSWKFFCLSEFDPEMVVK